VHLITTTEECEETERGSAGGVRVGIISPPLVTRTCCGWSFGHSRGPVTLSRCARCGRRFAGRCVQASEHARGRLVPGERRATDKTRWRGRTRPVFERDLRFAGEGESGHGCRSAGLRHKAPGTGSC